MIPEWAEKYRRPGTTIKKIGNGFYLYTATSHIVAGKKYPVSIQNYLGRITENGLIDARASIRISDTPQNAWATLSLTRMGNTRILSFWSTGKNGISQKYQPQW